MGKNAFRADGTARGSGSDAVASCDNRLLNEHEAAERLGLAVSTLRRWRWSRRGPAWCKVGWAVRYSPRDLQSFIDQGRCQPTAAG
jgi:hypothetical protein